MPKHFEIAGLQTTFHKKFVSIFIAYLHSKFHVPINNNNNNNNNNNSFQGHITQECDG
jgi:hypothetical protein